jgi:hypothetical protein
LPQAVYSPLLIPPPGDAHPPTRGRSSRIRSAGLHTPCPPPRTPHTSRSNQTLSRKKTVAVGIPQTSQTIFKEVGIVWGMPSLLTFFPGKSRRESVCWSGLHELGCDTSEFVSLVVEGAWVQAFCLKSMPACLEQSRAQFALLNYSITHSSARA